VRPAPPRALLVDLDGTILSAGHRPAILLQIAEEMGSSLAPQQAYRHAMAALGVGPHETWMVGDHLEWEVAAPQRLGICAVWCDGSGRGLPPGATVTPDHIVISLAQIVMIFADSHESAPRLRMP